MMILKKILQRFVCPIKKARNMLALKLMQSDEVKDHIAFMVEYSIVLSSYEKSLMHDHEPEEIEEQMMAYDEMAKRKAKILVHELGTNKRIFDDYSYEEQKQQVIAASNHLLRLQKISNRQRTQLIRDFIVQYGDIHKVNQENLRALVTDDKDMSDALKEVAIVTCT